MSGAENISLTNEHVYSHFGLASLDYESPSRLIGIHIESDCVKHSYTKSESVHSADDQMGRE